jgi:ubiquinone/menaquinone biosynthesis C-methylase UbiE
MEDSEAKSPEIRKRILDDYYESVYEKYLFSGGAQALGITYFEKQIENFWINATPNSVLEIGGGSGEHLPFLNYVPIEKYVSLDLRESSNQRYIESLPSDLKKKLIFVKGDAQDLPFDDNSFDRVFSTCLLHHVDDVLGVILEAKRVTKHGGEIAFVFPTDPGLLNHFVKRMISYRKMRKVSSVRPQLFYALEHKNHVFSIIELIKFAFQDDELHFHYRPFAFFKSWNLNLLVVAKIIRK